MIEQASEKVMVIGAINPQDANNTTKNTGTTNVDMTRWFEVMFIFLWGTIDSTLDFKVQSSPDGSTWSDLSGKAITQITSGNNKQVIVNVRQEQLPATHRYLRGLATLGNGSDQLIAALALGCGAVYPPASALKPTSVVQVVT